MSIYCIGQACFDITGKTDATEIICDSKLRFDESFFCAGGPALNAACVAAKWGGVSAYLVARLGNDFFGREVLRSLEPYGVHTDYLIDDKSATTPFSFIVAHTKTGERTIFNFPTRQKNVEIPLPIVDENKNIHDNTYEENLAHDTHLTSDCIPRVLLADGHDVPATHAYLEAFPNIPLVVDAGTLRQTTLDVARRARYLITSQKFATQYVEHAVHLTSPSLASDLAYLRTINNTDFVATTLGKDGVVCLYKNDVYHIPTLHVEVADSTGAGDIFHGAFAYAIHEGFEPLNALRLSAVCAALSTTKMGSQASIPTLEEVRANLLDLPQTTRLTSI